MPVITAVFGVLLTALGAWGGLGGEGKSWTAWIPAFVGVPLLVLGLLAMRESLLKHAMHAAAAVGLLGFLAALGRLVQSLVRKGTVEGRPGVAVAIMTGLCALFVALCVNSFIQARRRRRAAATQAVPAP